MSQASAESSASSGGFTNNASIGFTGNQMMWAIIAVVVGAVLIFLFKGKK